MLNFEEIFFFDVPILDFRNCGKKGHIETVCRQPQKQEAASGGTALYLEGSRGSVSATLETDMQCLSLASHS
jgi:hypothetical protein